MQLAFFSLRLRALLGSNHLNPYCIMHLFSIISKPRMNPLRIFLYCNKNPFAHLFSHHIINTHPTHP